MLTHSSGGWPLTLFLDPLEHAPFFSGTYFPKEPRYQLPAFKDLLRQIANFYQQQSTEVSRHSQQLLGALRQLSPTTASGQIPLSLVSWQAATQQLDSSYDVVNGGFGGAPKFPNPNNLQLLLCDGLTARQENNADNTSLDKVTHSLEKMASGGIYDQLGGGFYRYSVDARWEIPHFEKMLYDNAQLLVQYATANALTPKPIFNKILQETATWVLREMQSLQGGYYSAIDADSEGAEGRFYLWTPQQVKSLLSPEEYQLLSPHFNLTQAANFEGHATNTNPFSTEVSHALKLACSKLFQARTQRIRPYLDDKILTFVEQHCRMALKGIAPEIYKAK